MTFSFYTSLKGNSNDRFEAMWAKIVRSDLIFVCVYMYMFIDFISKLKKN